jgi:hypothetical protein
MALRTLSGCTEGGKPLNEIHHRAAIFHLFSTTCTNKPPSTESDRLITKMTVVTCTLVMTSSFFACETRERPNHLLRSFKKIYLHEDKLLFSNETTYSHTTADKC